ncbi:MAG: GDSL-type esterase/lipase family protein [Bacillota bacterium]|nr:GDSL-type esterase/lipase family protein [Bacillota bacterium]
MKKKRHLGLLVIATMVLTIFLTVFIGSVSMAAAVKSPDLNGDGTVNMSDVILLATVFNSTLGDGKYKAECDLNSDNSINMADVIIVANQFNTIIHTNTPTNKPTNTPTFTPTKTNTPTNTPTPTPATQTKVKGSEVLFIGESFLALSHDIRKDLETIARNNGVLASNDSFRDNSVSGTRLYGGISPNIPTQYKNAITAGPVKYVVMTGGGNDCLQGTGDTDINNAVNAAKTLFAQMKTDGVQKVFYIFYPDPVNNNTLKSRLEILRPQIQSLVTQSTAPKAYFLDLRPIFEGKYSQYILSDGIHPSAAGSQATADAVWDQMKKNNFFSVN